MLWSELGSRNAGRPFGRLRDILSCSIMRLRGRCAGPCDRSSPPQKARPGRGAQANTGVSFGARGACLLWAGRGLAGGPATASAGTEPLRTSGRGRKSPKPSGVGLVGGEGVF